MNQLVNAFKEQGLQAPPGLIELIAQCPNRKTAYQRLWIIVKFVAGLGPDAHTYTYPKEVRAAIRARFPGRNQGAYDKQYENAEGVYHVTLKELSEIRYP